MANTKNTTEILDFLEKKIAEHGLNIKPISAEYTDDGTKISIRYSSEEKADLRELVYDLASEFKTKVELRQCL